MKLSFTHIAVNNRSSNIELLRLVVMAFIVLHHFVFHGLGQYRYLAFGEDALLTGTDYYAGLIADSFLIVGVNVFILISGYFSIKFTAKGFTKLFCMCSFFTLLGLAIYVINNGLMGGGILGTVLRAIKYSICVISSKKYWFIQLYFLLMFLSIPLNKYIEVASKKSVLYTIGVLIFMNVYLGWFHGIEFVKDGYNLFNFILLYLIGRYLKLYSTIEKKKGIYLLLFIASSVCTAVLAICLHLAGGNTYLAFTYNSPFVMTGAVTLFLFFRNLNFNSKTINFLAASCLSIYLFQEGCFNFYKRIRGLYQGDCSTVSFFLYIFLFFVISMIIPLAIDKLRLIVFSRFENKLSSALDKKVISKIIPE